MVDLVHGDPVQDAQEGLAAATSAATIRARLRVRVKHDHMLDGVSFGLPGACFEEGVLWLHLQL